MMFVFYQILSETEGGASPKDSAILIPPYERNGGASRSVSEAEGFKIRKLSEKHPQR